MIELSMEEQVLGRNNKTWLLVISSLKELFLLEIRLEKSSINRECLTIQGQIVTNLKLKFWQNSRTQIVKKLKNSKFDETQKLKLWQNSET